MPLPSIYCFISNSSCERFDVYLDDFNGNGKKISFGYVDDKSITQDADTIEDAIRHYNE